MDNREAILDSALTLFYEKGYDAVGVQQIVEQAGVTKPTLYYYFGSKQGLLESLLRELFASAEERLRAVVQSEGKVPEKLYRTARCFFDCAAENPRFYVLIMALLYSGRKSEGFQAVYPMLHRYYRIFVELFERSDRELGNMNGRQEQFASVFSGMLNHYLLTAAQNREDLTGFVISDEEVYQLVRQFMYGIYS